MSRVFGFGAVVAALLVLSPIAARAQQMMTLPHGLYAGIDAGVIIPESLGVHGSASGGGETVTANGNLNFDNGAATGLMLGLHLNPWLALEGNFEYAGFDMRSITGSGTATGAIAASGPFDFGVNGHMDTFNFLTNAIFTPLGQRTWGGFSPYIGGGIGFSTISASLDSITSGGTTVTVNGSDNETDFAANGIVGVDYRLSPQLTIGGRYRLLYVNTASSGNSGGIFASNDDFIGHVLTANATWHF